MKPLLFIICFYPLLGKAQIKYVSSNNEVTISHFDVADFHVDVAKSSIDEMIISGNAHLVGNVKVKFGENIISCDSANFNKEGMIAYNASIFTSSAQNEVIYTQKAKIDFYSEIKENK